MRDFFRGICVIVLLLGLLAGGCGTAKKNESQQKLKVVATNFAAYDFARQIAKDKAEIMMLLPPGAESHIYEPTPQDMKRIQNADVFIYVGGESDAWVDKTLKAVGNNKMKIVKFMDCVTPVREVLKEGMQAEKEPAGHEHEKEEAEYDEHIWTSPLNAIKISERITAVLTEADAVNKDAYKAALQKYTEQLRILDQKFRKVVQGGKRKVIVFGDRFALRYFVDTYGLDYYAAFPGCAGETEPSASTVAFLIKRVKRDKIPVVFHMELANEKTADIICEATGARKKLFNACHNLSKNEFKKGVTYLDLMNKNVEVLREALQ